MGKIRESLSAKMPSPGYILGFPNWGIVIVNSCCFAITYYSGNILEASIRYKASTKSFIITFTSGIKMVG